MIKRSTVRNQISNHVSMETDHCQLLPILSPPVSSVSVSKVIKPPAPSSLRIEVQYLFLFFSRSLVTNNLSSLSNIKINTAFLFLKQSNKRKRLKDTFSGILLVMIRPINCSF